MRYSLETAITEARRIRRNLVRSSGGIHNRYSLNGDCGLASILLAVALDDVKTLRKRDGHAFNMVKGTIIDITATQFNYYGTSQGSKIHGVLVTKEPREYHVNVVSTGLKAYLEIVSEGWYDESDHPRWNYLSRYFL